MRPAWLVLADGSIYEGRSVGADGETSGEIVFHTGLSGYQEIITDPSYCGQIVTFTCPHIGNVGVNPDDIESARPHVRGLVMRDYCPTPSNWRSAQPLHRYLRQHNIVAIEGVDTRAVTRRIRVHGAMPGIISTEARDPRALIARAEALPSMEGQELVSEVTCQAPYEWKATSWKPESACASGDTQQSGATKIVVFDFGVKTNILRCLRDTGVQVEVVPATTSAQAAMARQPSGVLFSNGPGDPAAVEGVVETIQGLLGKTPLFGICLGHQLMARALGAKTFKLPFGHHGANQPVQELSTGRVDITSQNHGFAVDPESFPDSVEVTHRNLNDGTVEGFRSRDLPVFAVQYHPEASPGPHDACSLFDEFLELCNA